MNTKQCKRCSKTYQITDNDLEFYNKIEVPEPTHCPNCRLQRRLAFRNERFLYQDKCDLCKKDILSVYSENKNIPVYCDKCWRSEKWNPLDFGQDIDFNRPFFEQLSELQKKVPRFNLIKENVDNCEYANVIGDCRNCYLIFGSIECEDCYFGDPYHCKSCVDSLALRKSEMCYECISSEKLYHCLYCQDCFDSDDLMFCYDCRGCTDCIGCAGLRNQSYYIFNKKYSKEEYKKEKARINLCDPQSFNRIQKHFNNQKLKHARKFMMGVNNEDVSGNYLNDSKHVYYSFNVEKAENSRFLVQIYDIKEAYDVNHNEHSEVVYEISGAYRTQRSFFNFWCWLSHDIYYSDTCIGSHEIFGSVSLNHNKYCILNKQYSENEYKELKNKLIEHMKKTGEWGEFPPVKNSLFGYNETVAQDFFPIKEEQVKQNKWKWQGKDKENYETQTYRVPQNIEKVPEKISKEVLACNDCSKNYRIIPQELEFYKRQGIPIPKLCPHCRHTNRLKMRTPFALWHRQCMCTQNSHNHQGRCLNEFETSYSPDGKELVYCGDCYNKEIY
ncbi:hypothetical protein KKC88_02195 [Patescibacteria group bacterium]|nr:hypothetical protein [Patescibacteria group bacterium]MBU1673118.1 hypothetical protein [Patescibacteria group bacterium]MBU1963796.1 hypothetical protein [Patescibacteria group bacterium]